MTSERTNIKKRLGHGEQLLGPLVSLASTDVAEVLAAVGFDYLWMECEHSPMGVSQVQPMIQAVGGRCPCLVRVPENREVWFKKALDTGCDGIVVPQVRTAQEAQSAVAWSLYPPAGSRSVGISRAHGYGMSFQEYVESANDRLAIVLQVEHIDGVRNIRAIAQVEGIDAIFIGPYDLSGSLGMVGKVDHPEVAAAVSTVTAACREANVVTGIFVTSAGGAREALGAGHGLVAMGMDVVYLWQAAADALAQARQPSGA